MTPLSLATTRLASITHFVLVSRDRLASFLSLRSIIDIIDHVVETNMGDHAKARPLCSTLFLFLYRDTFLDEKHVDQCVMCHTHDQTEKKVGGWSADGNEPTTTRTVIGAGESESAAGRDGFSGA